MSKDLIKEIAHRIADQASHGEPRSLEEVIAQAIFEYKLASAAEAREPVALINAGPEFFISLENGVAKRREAGASDSSPFAMTIKGMECLLGSLRRYAKELRVATIHLGFQSNMEAQMQGQYQQGLGRQGNYTPGMGGQ